MDHSLEQEVNLLHAQVCQGLADPKRILLLYALADRRVVEALDLLRAMLGDLLTQQADLAEHLSER